MKRWIAFLVCAFACVAANADELATGIKAWEQHGFATAQSIFIRYANAGNPQALQMLGEMAGYGEGVTEDLARAETLLGKAIAAGNKDAAESLANVRQRAARKADIARLADSGVAPQSLAAFGCAVPAVPQESMGRQNIAAIGAKAREWRSCYGRYGAYLKALPAVQADVARLMNLNELVRTRNASDQAAARAAVAAGGEAMAFAVAYDRWFARTASDLQLMDDFRRSQHWRGQIQVHDFAAAEDAAWQAKLSGH